MRHGLLVTSLALAACTYDKAVPTVANGGDGQLQFSFVERPIRDGNVGVVPVGTSRTIVVMRRPGATVECRGLGVRSDAERRVDGVSVQGGPAIPRDTCDAVAAVPVVLQSATCEADACVVSGEERGTSVVLHVSSRGGARASTRLRVTLASADGSESWDDHIAIGFAPAARIKLTSSERQALLPLRMPLLPGLAFPRPTARVVDANDQPMSIDDSALQATVASAGVLEERTPYTFVTVAPGRAELRWELPGAITRVVPIEVSGEPATALELLAPPSRGMESSPFDLDALNVEDLAPSKQLDDVTLPARSRAELLMRVRLADGRGALAPIEAVAVDPPTLARPSISATRSWGLSLDRTSATPAGEGSVTIEGAGMTRTLPLAVTESP